MATLIQRYPKGARVESRHVHTSRTDYARDQEGVVGQGPELRFEPLIPWGSLLFVYRNPPFLRPPYSVNNLGALGLAASK